MKFKLTLSLFVAVLAFSASAQDLVKNGGFEDLDKKIKDGGQISLATGWTSPTATQADVFSTEAKTDEFGAPENKYGKEKPMEGESYAGIVAYSYKDKEPRSYITSELTREMKEGEEFCVRFNVSLSDLSKYSINNVAALISDKPIEMQASTESILIKPQVQHSRNKIMAQQVYYEPVCTKFTAVGGEKFITIGNFASNDATEDKKVKRPSGFTGAQFNIAYYYVDNVTILPINKDECICEKEVFEDTPDVVESTVTTSVSPEELKSNIESVVATFDRGLAVLSDEAREKLDLIADYIALDSDLIIVINGHTTKAERTKPSGQTLGMKRAQIAYKYLTQQKQISTKRLKFEDVRDTQPVISSKPEEVEALNQSITFKAFGL